MGLVFIPLRYGEQSIGRAFGSSISSEESCIQTIRIVGLERPAASTEIFDGNAMQFEEKCEVFRQENVPNAAKIPVDAYQLENFCCYEDLISKNCLLLRGALFL